LITVAVISLTKETPGYCSC